ncbi:hypothetical protein JYU34_011667 [Plutella xylostella]|uniref:Uncharacterized protein n=1 Tax=Plutella xylostella TaxID=51655 RepID=A0ABQ7QDF5_PLUXY|nr:hypothetical protein JYU34_011667 [Plutella xylostella]
MTDEYSSKRRTPSLSSAASPLHFALHRPGCQLESCCGVCNLFPGVILIAFSQVLVGAVLLTLVLTHGEQYDELHNTQQTQLMSAATGVVLSGVTGAGFLLLAVALTENCRAMVVYLLVASMVWLGIVSLATFKITTSCVKFGQAPKVKDDMHSMINLACVSGLFTFLGAVVYLFSFVVVFSFYHFRYVRRAILLHEAECT